MKLSQATLIPILALALGVALLLRCDASGEEPSSNAVPTPPLVTSSEPATSILVVTSLTQAPLPFDVAPEAVTAPPVTREAPRTIGLLLGGFLSGILLMLKRASAPAALLAELVPIIGKEVFAKHEHKLSRKTRKVVNQALNQL